MVTTMKLSLGSRCVKYLMFIFNLLFVFTSLLVVVFILEFSGGISGYVLRARASSIIQNKMRDSMQMYKNSSEVLTVWNNLQRDFDCCGTTNASDWVTIGHMNANDIPPSCCIDGTGVEPKNCSLTSAVVHQGCYNKFLSFVKSHAMQLGGVGLGIAFVQLTGIMIISIGTTIYAVYEDFSHFLDPSYFSPATLLIVVGIFVFIIAFLGCCGALRESTCMVLVFAVSLSLVLVLELIAGIAAYTLQDGIKDLLADKINATMHQYENSGEARSAIDFLQSKLYCCGYNGYEDWEEQGMTIPLSCPSTDINKAIYVTGCIERLSIIIHRSALYIGTGAVAIALIQLTGIMFACMLGRAIRRQKTERERRRWELRESLVNGYQPLGKSDPFTTFPVVYMSSEPLKNS
ncbi:CD63 antigen-like isoform X2 [Bombus terrestris]|uniref:CD63 antigen-like isoform X2 n=1 Tax=Bombus terrestris TaxID=30195 RepID=A0A9C6WBI2_BOMTE|nr:CD63 antigen-like isoform X2 [Bombus terrestris]